MQRKYNAVMITVATIFDSSSENIQEISKKNTSDILGFIVEGYEIISAIPTTTNTLANITYILRKKID